MPSLQIRSLPIEVYEALVVRAKAEHRSLAQQAVADLENLPELKARERRLAVVRELRNRLQRGGRPRNLPEPEALIREDRDR